MNRYLIFIILMLAVNSLNAKKVRFAVDMTGQTINTTGVHVSGDFQEEAGYDGGDWQSNTTEMTSETGNNIYSVIVDIPAFQKYEYKFINGDQWYEVEFVPLESRVGYDFNDNRWVYVDSLYNDTTLIAPVLFSGNAPAGFYLLRLKVDMGLQNVIDPAGVHVALDFQDFDTHSTILYSFTDDIYEQIVYTEMWTDIAQCYYRFVNGDNEAGLEIVPADCSFDGNRFIETSKDSVIETVCFSACINCDLLGTIENSVQSGPLLYPNPCRDITVLEFNDPQNSHNVCITDIFGNSVRCYNNLSLKSFDIHRDGLPAGIYFVKIESGNHWLATLRLVISQ
jgi:alpha-amylase